jgi:ABC-type tungstate transport system substrate-binding protein
LLYSINAMIIAQTILITPILIALSKETLDKYYVEYNEFLLSSSLSMAFLMICAQCFHIKVRNPFTKFIPSICLLILCLFIAAKNLPII